MRILPLALLLVALAPAARADLYWNGGTGSWNNSSFWRPSPGAPSIGTVPTASTPFVSIYQPGSEVTVNTTGNFSGATFALNVGNLYFNSGGSLTSANASVGNNTDTAAVFVASGTWNVGNNLGITTSSGHTADVFLYAGGALNVTQGLYIANSSSTLGTLTVGDFGTAAPVFTVGGGIFMGNGGTIRFRQNNTFNLNSSIAASNITSSTGTLVQEGSGTTNLNGTVALSTLSMTSGTLNFNAAGSSFIGAPTISNGTVGVASGATFGFGTLNNIGGAITVNSSGTLSGSSANIGTNNAGTTGTASVVLDGGSFTVGSLFIDTISSGRSATVTLKNAGSLGVSSAITLGSTSDSSHGLTSTLDIGGSTAFTGTFGASSINFGNGTLKFTQTNTFTLTSTLNSNNTGTVWQSGTGTTILNNNGTNFGGTVKLTAGTLRLGSAFALGSAASPAYKISFEGGTLQFSANNANDYSSHFATTGGQQYRIDTNGRDVTLATGLNSSGGTLTKLGAGSLILSAANSYNGPTTIAAGTLQVNHASALANSIPIRFTGGALQYSANNAVDYSARIGQSTSAIAIDTNGRDVTFATGLSSTNTAGLTKSGTGTLTLSGNNQYTGTTTINAGTLALSGGNAIPNTSDVILANTGSPTLAVNASETVASIAGGGNINIGSGVTLTAGGNDTSTSFGGTLNGSGTFAKAGTGTLTFTGSNDFVSPSDTALVVNGGTLAFAENVLRYGSTGQIQVNSGARLEVGTSAIVASQGSLNVGGTVAVNLGGSLQANSLDISGLVGQPASLTVSTGFMNTATAHLGDYSSLVFEVGSTGEFLSLDVSGVDSTFTVQHVGTSVLIPNSLTMSATGNGVINVQDGGLLTTSSTATIGSGGGTNTINLSGSDSHWTANGDVHLGSASDATLNIGTGTTVTINSYLQLGDTAGVTGTVNMFFGSLLEVGGTDGIRQGPGNAVLSVGGANLRVVNSDLTTSVPITLNGDLAILTPGYTATFAGALSGPGGLSVTGSDNSVILAAANTFTGGTGLYMSSILLKHTDALAGSTLAKAGSLAFDSSVTSKIFTLGGLADFALPSSEKDIALENNAGDAITLRVGNNNADTTAYVGALTGTGSFVKIGTGTTILARDGGSTFTGGTTIESGTLELQNTTGSALGSGPVSVSSGATLAGSFTITGDATITGTLSPGPATGGIGTANFNNLTLNPAATTNIQLDGAGSFDTINVSGTLTLDGSLVVTTTGGYVVPDGASFHIIGWSVLDASGFNPATDIDLSGAVLAPGAYWSTTDFLLTGTLVTVPEPSAYGIGMTALLGVTILLRRRKQAAL